ncbi:GAF domain-containing protein [Rubrolithibacter danxiaensis]|uniref:GAF domain-containing protein n=1 Tax=Rubrolithibacter danxiaensis TaxID=3390805 RepID=UPI003BF87173
MTQEKNYDSEFCGSLPLHQVNMIQPYGYLIVIDKKDLKIIQASENIVQLLAKPANQVVNTFLNEYLHPSEIHSITEKFQNDIKDKIPLTFSFSESTEKKEFLALLHAKADYIIIELEEVYPNEKNSFIDVFQRLKYIMAEIDLATTVREACSIAIRELKKLSGFDKVMMYTFDEEWNGTVIAEAMEEGMDAYYGLKFPASDIPKQARQLYLTNPYRLIPNREYTPVRLYPVINPLTHAFIDLSDCNLRSVAAVHLEYLGNMNVMASMSTRVLINELLWGLISCHHRQEKHLSYEMCSAFELLSNFISAKISSIIHKEHAERSRSLQEKQARIIEQVYSKKNLVEGLFDEQVNIMDLIESTGAAINFMDNITTIGSTPSVEEIENLLLWLQTRNTDTVYNESKLPKVYDDADNYYKIASSILAIPINTQKGYYIVLFRPEVIQTVSWGGNPNEAINFDSDKKNYHPRNSFNIWKQVVQKTSVSWTREELDIAERLRSFIYEFSTRYLAN